MKLFLWSLIFLTAAISPAYAQKIMVVTENNPPYQEIVNGQAGGICTEIVKAVLEEANIDHDIKVFPWARAYKMALSYDNVLIYSIARSPKREELFHWIGAIIPFSVYLYKLKESNLQINSLEDAKNYSIGVIREGFRHQFFLKKGFVEDVNLHPVNDFMQNILKIQTGRVDFLPFDEMGFEAKAKVNNVDISRFEKTFKLDEMSTYLYLALSKKTSHNLVEQLTKALEDVKKSNQFRELVNVK